ncbi:MAG: hypothetical protein EA424_26825, partial [Planctomycetaceae bacterium]
MPPKWDVAPMFRADLQDARRAWLEAAHGPEERLQWEQSDFLTYTNHEGEKADFHALRHTCGAWLAVAGVHPKVVQTVLRHSAITLTMDTYGHLFPGQDAAAVAALPSMMNAPKDGPEELQATGTDDGAPSKVAANRQRANGEKQLKTAKRGEGYEVCSEDSDESQVVTLSGLGKTGRDVAKVRLLGLEPRTYGLKVRCSTD